MQKLAYVGPKPLISHTGVDFDKNQDDKFNYLIPAIELIKALDHNYFEERTYIYKTNNLTLNQLDLINSLKHYCPDLEKLLDKRNHDVEAIIADDLVRIQESYTLTQEDKEAFRNNINIMHDYLIQYSINKSVYECTLHKLAQLVTKDHIDHIIVPMFQKFTHVLNDLQKLLKDQKHAVDTDLEIFKGEKGELLTKLQVINLLQ